MRAMVMAGKLGPAFGGFESAGIGSISMPVKGAAYTRELRGHFLEISFEAMTNNFAEHLDYLDYGIDEDVSEDYYVAVECMATN